jgi:hypothetical protein
MSGDQPDGAKRLVYALHQQVNLKLETQDLEKYKNQPDELKKVQCKWQQYRISYDDALEQRYHDGSNLIFWHACTQFLAFVLCDWRPHDFLLYTDFFASIGQILSRDPRPQVRATGKCYLKTLRDMHKCWKVRAMKSLDVRLDLVYDLRTEVFIHQEWTETLNKEQFYFMTKNGIVGCTQEKKK